MPAAVTRLKRRSDFLRIAAQRRKWAAPGLILQAAPTPRDAVEQAACPADEPDGVLRVGFTVSKKVGNSVARSRAKRRLRAAAQEIMAAKARPATDYVLIGRRETLTRPYSLLLQDLRTALKRLGALRDEEAPLQTDT